MENKYECCNSCDLHNTCKKSHWSCNFSDWLYRKYPRVWKFIKKL